MTGTMGPKPAKSSGGLRRPRLAGSAVALDLDVAAREPGVKTLERGHFLALEVERRGHQLVDRVARDKAEPPVQFAPPVERSGQDRLEEPRGRGVIRHREQFAERVM